MLLYPTAIFRFRHGRIFVKLVANTYQYPIMTSSNADKKYLRQLGHNLKPVVTIASKGLTESVQLEIERALNDHELIKLKLVTSDRDSKKILTEQICSLHGAELIQSIGHILLIHRASMKPNPKLSNILRQ